MAGAEIVTPRARVRRWPRVLAALGLVGVLAASGLGVATWTSAQHVRDVSAGRTFTVDDVPSRPIAMVLGAKADPGRPSAFLAARLDLAVQLYDAGKIRAILVSGDGRDRSNNEPKVMLDYLTHHGVPAEKIVEDPAGFDTYDSCVRARDVFGVRDVVLLTQAYHLPRAITICTDVGVDAVGAGDTTVRERFPDLYSRGEAREWAANLKMQWDLGTRRVPQQDPYDPTLLEAAQG